MRYNPIKTFFLFIYFIATTFFLLSASAPSQEEELQIVIKKQNELIEKLRKANKVTQAHFENQHNINVEMDAKLNELYRQITALKDGR